MASSASTALHFPGLGESDAERLLAAIWLVLEERGLPTPLVDVQSGNPSLNVTLTFESVKDCATIANHVNFVLTLNMRFH